MFRIIPRQGIFHFKRQFHSILKERSPVESFERKLAGYLDIKNVAATGSATLSLYLILKQIKKTDRDEVILSGYNYYDLVNVIVYCGMKPIFVDIKKDLQMDINNIKKSVTKNTRAILVTYLFGFPCDIKKILKIAKKDDIYVIEDCSHALGACIENKKLGSFGDFGIFSFNRWKIIDCFGGGAIASNNDKIMMQIKKKIREYKQPSKVEMGKRILFNYLSWFLLSRKVFNLFIFPAVYLFHLLGKDILFDLSKDNLTDKFSDKKKRRFTELQAAIGLKMLDHIDYLNTERRKRYEALNKSAKNKAITQVKVNIFPTLFPVYTDDKKNVRSLLLKNGVDMIDKFYGYSFTKNNIEEKLILLPIHVTIKNSDLTYIASILNQTKV